MSFGAYAQIITFYMTAIGVASSWLVSGISPVFMGAITVLSAVALVYGLRGGRLLTDAQWGALSALAFAFFIADLLFLSRDIIIASTRFLNIMLVLRLADLKTDRDNFFAFAIVFFQLTASAASTISPVFFVLLFLFIVGGIFAMIVFSIKKDAEDYIGAGQIPNGPFGTPFFLAILAVSVASLIVTIVLFFMIPRFGVGFFEKRASDAISGTGFSDSVEFGAMGELKLDPTVVMRVGLKEYAPSLNEPLYFRGQALDKYDGTGWHRSTRKKAPTKVVDGAFSIRQAASDRIIEQEILLEPMDTDVAFAADGALNISGNFSILYTDDSGSLFFQSAPYSRVKYIARSAPGAVVQEKSPSGMGALAYLDTSFVSAEVRSLARKATLGARTDLERAAMLEKFFTDGFTYTLSPKKSKGKSALDDFLLDTKEGYCEHFATAMVLMLRSTGVPARLVTGFLHGEWNGYGGFLKVRRQDAHTWVEAYVDGRAWTRFDPTPQSATAVSARSDLALYLDLMQWRWNRYVVQYSFADQRSAAMSTAHGVSAIRSFIKGLFHGNMAPELKKSYLAAPLIVAAIVLIVLFARRRLSGRRDVADKAHTPIFYKKMLGALDRKGITKALHETPMEFANRINDPDVFTLTHAHESQRYAMKELSYEEKRNVEAGLQSIRKKKFEKTSKGART